MTGTLISLDLSVDSAGIGVRPRLSP